MPTPLVSIIIPCYNAEKYVAEAIQSALDQTYPNCEVIVIDDGSTDGSLEVIKSFGDKIRWESGPNRGGCAARNRGLELAKGKFIKFLDADDLIHPECVSIQLRFAKNNPKTAVNCNLFRFKGKPPAWNKVNQDSQPVVEKSGFDFVIGKCLGEMCQELGASDNHQIGHSLPHCWLLPREVIERSGPWDTRLIMCQDTDYFQRCALVSEKVVSIPTILCLYRVDAESSVSKGMSSRHMEAMILYCRKTEDLLATRNDERVRIAVARNYFNVIVRFQRKHRYLHKEAIFRIRALHVPIRKLAPSFKMSFLIQLIGIDWAIRFHGFYRKKLLGIRSA